jgi:predicted RNA binding protein YcfA (HicA-like mRNA interferase family)
VRYCRTDFEAARDMKKQSRQWSSTKARPVLAALLRNGWRIKRQKGSHRLLVKAGWQDYTFAYHDRVEIGRVALELLGKKTGLRPEDL